MTSVPAAVLHDETRREYLRPLELGIAFGVIGELLIFLIFGLRLNGFDHWPAKLARTVGFCGVGMGRAVGALVDLLIVGRWGGVRAIAATAMLSTVILSVVCDVRCWRLDLGLHYFGRVEGPVILLVNGIVGAAAGGIGLGAGLFSAAGREWLARYGL